MKEKQLTGYPSIDLPQSKNATFFEKNPIIPNTNIYTLTKLLTMVNLKAPAINCKSLTATYEELINDSVTISLALKELGVKKGDIVSVCMPNLYQALASFFACNRIGAVTTLLDSTSPKEEVCSLVNMFESPVLLNYDKNDEYNEFVKNKSHVKHIITLNKQNVNSLNLYNNYKVTSNDKTIDFSSLGSIASYQKNKLELPHSSKEDALILYTSGSTGKSKAVVLTNENVIAAEMYAMNTSHTGNINIDKTLICVPFSYPYGFVTSALSSVLWGKETILAPDISKDTIDYYYSKKPNFIFGSPALLDLTMNNVKADRDLSSVTHFASGGDFLTPAHAKRGIEFFEKHNAYGVEIGNGFGNAETVSIGSTPIGVPLRQETAGKLLVGVTPMIVDEDTLEEKKYGEEGLLCVSGKHVFKEYFNNKELTEESKFVKNGKTFYKTGTLGYIDTEGYFTVTGRQSRFYIMSTLNKVYCDKIQNLISSFDCVKDCAIVKVPDENLLYVNKAYIVLNDGVLPNDETIKHINDLLLLPKVAPNGTVLQLKPYEMPTYFEFVNELPRKAGTEKIHYSLLEEDAKNKLEKNKTLIKK